MRFAAASAHFAHRSIASDDIKAVLRQRWLSPHQHTREWRPRVAAMRLHRAADQFWPVGYDLRKLPLIDRKAHLKELIAKTAIQFSESFDLDGKEMFKHACSIGLEGVVSKVRDSRYHCGRTNDWVKVTCQQRETLPIAGFAIKENKFDGIYVGLHKGKNLVYAGKVDHGFDPASAKKLQARLKPLIRKTQPYAKKIAHRGIWVEPSLLAEIEYRVKSANCAIHSSMASGKTCDAGLLRLERRDGSRMRSGRPRQGRRSHQMPGMWRRCKLGQVSPEIVRPAPIAKERAASW
jgi:hypothetical protein